MELEHAIGFDGTASNAFHIHPDGENIVYVLGGCVVISQLKDAHNQVFLRGHDDLLTCLDVSASGRLIASGQAGDNADVVVWHATDGKEMYRELYRLQEHDLGVLFVLFSADERFLLTVGKDKKMIVWDMHTGNIVAKTGALKQAPMCACWGGRARDRKNRETTNFQLATGGEAHLTVWTLDVSDGSLLAEGCSLGNQVRNFTTVTFSSDGAYLYAGSSSSDFTAVHIKNKVMHATTVVGSNGVKVLLCEPIQNGDRVIVGCGDGSVTVFEGVRDGAQTCRVYSKGPPEKCAVMLDGAVCALQLHSTDEASGQLKLLAGTQAGSLYAVDVACPNYLAMSAPPAQSRALQRAHFDRVVAVAYPKDSSEQFATASADGTIRVWDVNDYSIISTGACQTRVTGEPMCLDFTGDVSFSGWGDGRIRSHHAATGEELWTIDNAHRGGCTALAVSHNHKFIVSGGEAGEVRVWEIRNREMVVHLKQHTSPVTSLQLEANDQYVYSSSRDRTIISWDLRAEARLDSMTQRMGGINAIAMLPPDDARSSRVDTLLSVGQEKLVSVWARGESAPILTQPASGEQYCIALYCLEPSVSAIFATAGAGDHHVRLYKWNAAGAPELCAVGPGHSSAVRGLQFSPDGKQLVSVGDDGAVFVWNIFIDEI